MTAVSPISVQSGLSDMTDNDILLDKNGYPFIPGSTIAGVCRHYIEELGSIKADKYFGSDKDETKSRIVFYDANCLNCNGITIRDGVALNDKKVAIPGAKFDYEILEEGSTFELRMEFDYETEEDLILIDKIISGFNHAQIRIGAKSNRGMGNIKLDGIFYKKYILARDINDLIEFSWDKVDNNYLQNTDTELLYEKLEYAFKIPAFIMIANNAATTIDNNQGKIVDSEMRLNHDNEAVIPGTTWAGVFRHHILKILKHVNYENADEFVNALFGDTNHSSEIVFKESVIKGGRCINQTRNAIDRFTGGACDKKLFTKRLNFGGGSLLEIMIKKNIENFELVQNLIEVCIKDFNDGILTVGGLSGVGGGMISVEEAVSGGKC